MTEEKKMVVQGITFEPVLTAEQVSKQERFNYLVKEAARQLESLKKRPLLKNAEHK